MKKNSGFSFIEVMVCVVILSTGILGLMGLQVRGLRNNVSANQRTQATVLTYNISERIRANTAEAAKGAASVYATTTVSDSTAVDANCQPATPTTPPATSCTSAAMAVNDLVQWNRELTTQYCGGNGTTNIVCNGAPLGRITYVAPSFIVTVSWDDNHNDVIDNRDPVDPTKSCYKTSANAETTLTDLSSHPVQYNQYDPCFRTSFSL